MHLAQFPVRGRVQGHQWCSSLSGEAHCSGMEGSRICVFGIPNTFQSFGFLFFTEKTLLIVSRKYPVLMRRGGTQAAASVGAVTGITPDRASPHERCPNKVGN